MSDFLKKISGNEDKKADNPFNKLFEEKKQQLGFNEQKKEEENKPVDGIENLGNSPTKSDKFTMEIEQEPAKIESSEKKPEPVEQKGDFLNQIPTKSLENADIFSDAPEPTGTLNLNTSSSYNSISFDEEHGQASPFTEEIIEKVSALLRKNDPENAVKLINEKKG